MLKSIIDKHLVELLEKQNKILEEILIEPYGSVKYEALKLHMNVLDLKITFIKELIKIKKEMLRNERRKSKIIRPWQSWGS